ncbi:MAG: endo-1,4-beta-xylanase [Dysgonamonadaceae bacterium]|jgi:GH35 family endo-1,4-beta-xylanase|nr:endo-1,4-beta-xylanase [Dysgonamonadaceae bacterium]
MNRLFVVIILLFISYSEAKSIDDFLNRNLTFDINGETKSFQRETNQPITAISSESWCTVRIKDDNTLIQITVPPYDDIVKRTATVSVFTDGSSGIIRVTQLGRETPPLDNWEGKSEANARIEQHRKENIRIVVKQNGAPVVGATVDMKMQKHEFLFGAYIAKWDRGEPYRKLFADIFNFATGYFQWREMEPTMGAKEYYNYHTRIADWCREKNILLKGHLISSGTEPTWLSSLSNEDALSRVLYFCSELSGHFKGQVDAWEVINEWINYNAKDPKLTTLFNTFGKADMAKACFAEARKANPNALLMPSDNTYDTQYPDFVKQLKDENGQVIYDAVGIQWHTHNHRELLDNNTLWTVIERLANLEKPVHITELTVVSTLATSGWNDNNPVSTTPEGELQQTKDVERLYTLFFSHPSIEAVSWWDFTDLNSWMGAPGGLLRDDMTPKPAYDVLKKLIKETWTTNEVLETDASGATNIRAFRGIYKFTVILPNGCRQVFTSVVRKGENELELNLIL